MARKEFTLSDLLQAVGDIETPQDVTVVATVSSGDLVMFGRVTDATLKDGVLTLKTGEGTLTSIGS